MRKDKFVVAYWADTELAFIEFARRMCLMRDLQFFLIRISHYDEWFTPHRSYFHNFLHLVKTFSNVLIKGFAGKVVFFGTNTCRILFFFAWLFKDVHYVYNELPSLSSRNLVFWIDQAIFRFARNVSVSTIERAKFICESYKINRNINVLENISFTDIPEVILRDRTHKAIFAGSITSKRFSENDVARFSRIVESIGAPIDVYGQVAGGIDRDFLSLISIKGKVSHEKIIEIMKDYEYGVLSYYRGEPNYDLCAPLKIYEYLACGCKVISLNNNKGLVELSKRFPALIYFPFDSEMDFSAVRFDISEDFYIQRQKFLSNAIYSNLHFAENLLS